ncbi:MAG TPA: bifunctional phosphopantothenoylcysteine decarboxylase/phosphopantothenate--cysteine ligase CoaBC [Acidimicrobiia bacterium]|nr:bifunctional phosphopantothenoylcysteine decarboxylase/phosphopantothenate--cysteine ligase CoaBC [Acidimicrobiia bacterium]
MLAGRRIVLAVSGGVAAFKAAHLARRLVEAGASVETIMTRSSLEFLGPQTLAAITGTHPHVDYFDDEDVSPHTTLARWADAIVIAPATAATLSRLANGLSDDLLSGTVLAFSGPVVVAPAMHTEMWEHPATRRNVATLEEDGVVLVGPLSGALAGGDEGPGRMVEPEDILEAVAGALGAGSLQGWRVVVTAGGTREPIDPVRFVGNRSSGKMGNAVALEAAERGAEVTLVTTVDPPDHPGIEVIRVDTADEMAEAVWERTPGADVAVLAAAVADFRPRGPATEKLRRAEGPPDMDLEATPDILAGVAGLDDRPILVGFAAEVGPVSGAAGKATSKGVDLLVANDVTAPGSGFGSDTNTVTVFTPDGSSEDWPPMPKRSVAARLWDRILEMRSGD